MLSANSPPSHSSFSSWRILSALELLLGAFIVIGHNVFHILPNEVPILFVLGLVSIRLRDGGWAAMGFKRPASWIRLVLIALAAAALRIILGGRVIQPLAAHFLASDSRSRRNGSDFWEYRDRSGLASSGLDLGGVRRGDRISRILTHSRGRPW